MATEVAHDPADRLGLEYLGLYGDFEVQTVLNGETGAVETVYLDFSHRATDTFLSFRAESLAQAATMAINWVHEWQDAREAEAAIEELNRQLELDALAARLDSEIGAHEAARLADMEHESALDSAWDDGYRAGYQDAKDGLPDFLTLYRPIPTGSPLVGALAASAYTSRSSCDGCDCR